MPDTHTVDADDERAVSPVIGGVLMIVIVALLAGVLSVMAFGLTDETEPTPQAQLDVEQTDCEYTLVHRSGDAIDGGRTELRGVENASALRGKTLQAGTETDIDPTDDDVELVWESETGESYVIRAFDVGDSLDACTATTGDVYTYSGGDVNNITVDGSTVSLPPTSDAQALGSVEEDVTGDGQHDLPFVDSSGTVMVTNASNDTTTVAESSDIPGTIEHEKTRLSAGTWNGSDTSVFFVNENHDTIYRATPSSSPQAVATPTDGAQAISGIGDVDGDGTAELVFADSSQQLRYLEPDGTATELQSYTAGQNNGIGTGALADFDGDGTESVVYINGSNGVEITDGTGSTTVFGSTQAKKAPPTAGDVDDDGDPEIVYVGDDNGYLKYIDDVGGANDIEFVRDDNGDKVSGSDTTGVT